MTILILTLAVLGAAASLGMFTITQLYRWMLLVIMCMFIVIICGFSIVKTTQDEVRNAQANEVYNRKIMCIVLADMCDNNSEQACIQYVKEYCFNTEQTFGGDNK